MEYTTVQNLQWVNAEQTIFDCNVFFVELNKSVPFTATQGDTEVHAIDIYTRGVAGEFGVISSYVAPPLPTVTERKATMLGNIKVDYSEVCSGKDPATGKSIYVDVEANSITYRMNAGADAATAMDNGVRIFERMGSPVMPVVRDFNNVNHENVPIADAITISTLQGADALGYWQQKGVMVDAINAAITEAELDAVNLIFEVNTL